MSGRLFYIPHIYTVHHLVDLFAIVNHEAGTLKANTTHLVVHRLDCLVSTIMSATTMSAIDYFSSVWWCSHGSRRTLHSQSRPTDVCFVVQLASVAVLVEGAKRLA